MEPFIKQYEGKQEVALAQYQADTNLMAERDYFPVSQTWVPSKRVFLCVVGIILIPFGVGILILLLLLFTQPKGYLNVTYKYREKTQSPIEVATAPLKTCPKCAEAVKAAATICRFCKYEFAANHHAVDLCESAQ